MRSMARGIEMLKAMMTVEGQRLGRIEEDELSVAHGEVERRGYGYRRVGCNERADTRYTLENDILE